MLKFCGSLRVSSWTNYKNVHYRWALWLYNKDLLKFPFRRFLIKEIMLGNITWHHLEMFALDRAMSWNKVNYALSEINAMLKLFSEFG